MKTTSFRLAFIFFCSVNVCTAQSYFDDKFITKTATSAGQSFTFYEFSRAGTAMKAKYFVKKNGQSAYSQYLGWKGSREILLVTSGAFCDDNSDIVGLCVDNGETINATADPEMDGMVIVYNGGAQQGGIAIVDMDYKPVTVTDSGRSKYFYPRSSITDRYKFLDWGRRSGVTLFQSQLLYSSDRSTNLSNLDYAGKSTRPLRERRFLAICRKSNTLYHIVVDAPDNQYLNRATYNAKNALESDGFSVSFIINLDTGSNDVLHVYNGSYLRDLNPNSDATVANVPNLLVYYKD